MCCSGNHNHNHNHKTPHDTDEKNGARRHIRMPMMLCCLIPFIAVIFFSAIGIGGSIKGLLPFLIIAACLGSHFFMNGKTHQDNNDCCESDEQKSQINK